MKKNLLIAALIISIIVLIAGVIGIVIGLADPDYIGDNESEVLLAGLICFGLGFTGTIFSRMGLDSIKIEAKWEAEAEAETKRQEEASKNMADPFTKLVEMVEKVREDKARKQAEMEED